MFCRGSDSLASFPFAEGIFTGSNLPRVCPWSGSGGMSDRSCPLHLAPAWNRDARMEGWGKNGAPKPDPAPRPAGWTLPLSHLLHEKPDPEHFSREQARLGGSKRLEIADEGMWLQSCPTQRNSWMMSWTCVVQKGTLGNWKGEQWTGGRAEALGSRCVIRRGPGWVCSRL